jgi:hypothetical protein
MYKLIGLLLVLAPLPAAAAGARGEWKVFHSKEGNYEVQLPGSPQENRNSVKTSVGTVYVVLAILEVKKHEGYYVGFSELPEAVIKSETEDRRLDNARDGAVSNSRGKLKSEKQIKLDGHKGRELEIEVDGKTLIRARLYHVNNRLYQVMVVGSRELVASADTGKFLDSFKLVK